MSKAAKKNRRKQQIGLINNIIFSLITLAALTGCIVLVLQNYSLRNESQEVMSRLKEIEDIQDEYIYTQADLDSYTREAVLTAEEKERENTLNELKQMMSTGDSTVSVLRALFPEDVVVSADGAYSFFPIEENLKKHDYVYDHFIAQDDNEIVYTDDAGTVLSIKGIDVSKHQGKIDWKRVSEDGVSYAFIRAGYRGSSEGKLVEDEFFADNMEGTADNGIQAGVYFYTQAMTEEEAREEARFLLDLIEPYEVTYPVVLDLEETGSDSARTANMTKEEYTKAAIAFCETIKEAGYTPMIYGNLKTFMIMLDMEQIEEYDKWFAYYDTSVYFPYEFAIWQYSSKGKISGITGNVDLNVGMKDYAKDSE
ncbi:MAG: hypothetical protein HDQ97_05730 [Lachnospiraceae bacterium]|nr:hypothetical protein [Lachnospiraceae bacterium]